MRMVSRSWQSCLEGPQNCPKGRGFCLFFGPGAVISQKFSARGREFDCLKKFPGDQPGGREFDYLKKFPGGQPGGMLVLGID